MASWLRGTHRRWVARLRAQVVAIGRSEADDVVDTSAGEEDETVESRPSHVRTGDGDVLAPTEELAAVEEVLAGIARALEAGASEAAPGGGEGRTPDGAASPEAAALEAVRGRLAEVRRRWRGHDPSNRLPDAIRETRGLRHMVQELNFLEERLHEVAEAGEHLLDRLLPRRE